MSIIVLYFTSLIMPLTHPQGKSAPVQLRSWSLANTYQMQEQNRSHDPSSNGRAREMIIASVHTGVQNSAYRIVL